MAEPASFDRAVAQLEAELRRLEAEYNMYFAGRMPRPPVETRRRVEGMVRRLDNSSISNYADRFRFSTLQARFVKFVELWDRGMRSREEGRPGPYGAPPPAARPSAAGPSGPAAPESGDRVVHVAAFSDPAKEPVKLRALYDRLVEARRSVGEQTVPFERFVFTVAEQVRDLKDRGVSEVAFRVEMKDGKVSLTAKGLGESDS